MTDFDFKKSQWKLIIFDKIFGENSNETSVFLTEMAIFIIYNRFFWHNGYFLITKMVIFGVMVIYSIKMYYFWHNGYLQYKKSVIFG